MHIGVLLRGSRAPVTNFPLANVAAFYMLFILSHLPLEILQVTMEDSIPLKVWANISRYFLAFSATHPRYIT